MNTSEVRPRSPAFLICMLLLLATTINYADRLTLNQLAPELMKALDFNKQSYGNAEAMFGIAYALGAIVWGVIVDRYGAVPIYPIGVILWSLAGFATGFVQDYDGLVICRSALGFCEAANWSCGIVITKKLLSPKDRVLGNGMFQSGTALGSILTPFTVVWLSQNFGWPAAFQFIGVLGFAWAIAWVVVLWKYPLRQPVEADSRENSETLGFGAFLLWLFRDRRFWSLGIMVFAINANWHLFRTWLPLYLREGRGFSENEQAGVFTFFFIAADVGALLSGFLIRHFAPTLGIFPSRFWVYLGCSLMTMASVPLALIESPWVLFPSLLILGVGSLGLFPIYFAFSQDLTTNRQGILTGILAAWNWILLFLMQRFMGWAIQTSQDAEVARLMALGMDGVEALKHAIHDAYPLKIAMTGMTPLAGALALWLVWPKSGEKDINPGMGSR